MHRLSLSASLPLILVCACSPAAPAEAPPEATAAPEATDAPPTAASPTAAPSTTAMPSSVVRGVDAEKRETLAAYELTPSDCDALGKQLGNVQRNDLLAGVSPKLKEKQRAAVLAQIDREVEKNAESWGRSCQENLVNKSVEHAAIKCALAAKTVKQFDVCLNGEHGKGDAPSKPAKRK
jgi:hypothetical protein